MHKHEKNLWKNAVTSKDKLERIIYKLYLKNIIFFI